MANKRKRDTTDNDFTEKASKKPRLKIKQVCILHSKSVPLKSKPFTTLSSVSGGLKVRLTELHRLRDIRLKEDVKSAYRMKDVCDKIPESIDGLDLKHMDIIQPATKCLCPRLIDVSMERRKLLNLSKKHRLPERSFRKIVLFVANTLKC